VMIYNVQGENVSAWSVGPECGEIQVRTILQRSIVARRVVCGGACACACACACAMRTNIGRGD
jgi:hypothetical protein